MEYRVTKKGTVYDKYSHKITVRNILLDWNKQKNILGDRYFKVDEDEVSDLIEELAEAESDDGDGKKSKAQLMKESRDNFRDMLRNLFDVRIFAKRSFQYVQKDLSVAAPVTVARASSMARSRLMDNAIDSPSKEDCLEIAISELEFRKTELVQDALMKIKYDPESTFSFKSFTEKVFEYYKIANTPLNRRMFKHMMHHIKRSAFYEFVEQKFWYLFFSRVQGIGKSRLVMHLAQPFVGGYATAELSQLLDPNDKKALYTSGAVLLDFKELGLGKGAKDADMSPILKKVQEEEILSSRQMYSDSGAETLCFAVLASSTNLRVEEVIPDSTGYRRFFSFDLGLTEDDKLAYNTSNKWKEIDKFWDENIIEAYRCLDEDVEPVIQNRPEKNLYIYSELCKVQDNYSNSVDILEQWMHETGIHLSDTRKEGYIEVELSKVYRDYTKWAEKSGGPRYQRAGFQTALSGKKSIRAHVGEDGIMAYWERVD